MKKTRDLWIMAEVTCDCGNKVSLEGFYPCDREGRPISASGLVCCERCGKIQDRSTGNIIGHRSFGAADIDPDAA